MPSRKDFSSTTSNFPPQKKQQMLPAAHFLRPTKLKAIENGDIMAEPRNSDVNLSMQNSQAVLRKPQEERNSEHLPSLDDPSLQKTLQYYILRGKLARQYNPGEQQEHDRV